MTSQIDQVTDRGIPAARSRLYQSMIRLRVFDERCRLLFLKGAEGLRGALHDGIGQEAVSAGVIAALREDDQVLSSHRCHAQVLAKGASPRRAFAEILGRSTGLCRGRGGSMHLTDVEHCHYGASGIIAGHMPIANGMALAALFEHSDRIVACFFGDGATSIGAFHEAINLAALWKLPVLFICENNQYTEQTRSDLISPVTRPAADRASAYGLQPHIVDGNDVEAVFETASALVAALRTGQGPALLEAVTYRINGHSLFDAAKYRPADEVDAWKARDPIAMMRDRLLGDGFAVTELDEIEEDVRGELEAALQQALEDPPPTAEDLMLDLWADGGSKWRA